jgi:ABC-2 type transport system ATP-binding protein
MMSDRSQGGAMLEVRNLYKNFGPLVAVDHVSFKVNRGEVLGLLGPNGAGKSTTMKMIAGFLTPVAGTAVVCGHDIQRQPLAAKRQIGYLPEGASAYLEMTVASFLEFVAQIRGMRGAEATARIDHVVELLGLGYFYGAPIETLSKGYRRRVGVAQALIHDPPVIVLDEPTDGLDPNQKYELRKIIAAMQPEKAIVISTHLLEEVEAVCERVVIIARGRVVVDSTWQKLITQSRYHNAVRLDLPPESKDQALTDLVRLADVAAVEDVSDGDAYAVLVFPRDQKPLAADISDFARARGWKITGLSVERGRLDEVFRSLTAEPSRVSS